MKIADDIAQARQLARQSRTSANKATRPSAFAANPITYLDRPVTCGRDGRIRIVGFDSVLGAPEWLRSLLDRPEA
jgi:hypothetical protein